MGVDTAALPPPRALVRPHRRPARRARRTAGARPTGRSRLTEVTVEAHTAVLTRIDLAEPFLTGMTAAAVGAGVVTDELAQHWLAEQHHRAATGRLLVVVPLLLTTATRAWPAVERPSAGTATPACSARRVGLTAARKGPHVPTSFATSGSNVCRWRSRPRPGHVTNQPHPNGGARGDRHE